MDGARGARRSIDGQTTRTRRENQGTRKRIAIEEDQWFNDHVDEIQQVVQQSESVAVLAQRQSDASEMVSTVSIKQEKI